jgi:hypothetical protein
MPMQSAMLLQVGSAGHWILRRSAPGILLLVGCPGQDIGPSQHGRATAATSVAICTIIVPKYGNSGAGSGVREDANGHGSESGHQRDNHGGQFKALELAAHYACLSSLLLPLSLLSSSSQWQLMNEEAITTP